MSWRTEATATGPPSGSPVAGRPGSGRRWEKTGGASQGQHPHAGRHPADRVGVIANVSGYFIM
jgi:hypothetical protein